MNKITIYGKKPAVALETIDNVEAHYWTNNGMFYVKAEGQEFYFPIKAISDIRIETESEAKINDNSTNVWEC